MGRGAWWATSMDLQRWDMTEHTHTHTHIYVAALGLGCGMQDLSDLL